MLTRLILETLEKTYRRRLRNLLLIPGMAFLCFFLVMMGALFWVDNSWTLITDSDPATMTQMGLLLDGGLDSGACQALDQDGDGVIPIAGGALIRGNGDRDDNKEEAYLIRRLPAVIVEPETGSMGSGFNDRRMVKAYKDFGHLKVMPEAEAAAVKLLGLFINQRLSVYIADSLCLFNKNINTSGGKYAIKTKDGWILF